MYIYIYIYLYKDANLIKVSACTGPMFTIEIAFQNCTDARRFANPLLCLPMTASSLITMCARLKSDFAARQSKNGRTRRQQSDTHTHTRARAHARIFVLHWEWREREEKQKERQAYLVQVSSGRPGLQNMGVTLLPVQNSASLD